MWNKIKLRPCQITCNYLKMDNIMNRRSFKLVSVSNLSINLWWVNLCAVYISASVVLANVPVRWLKPLWITKTFLVSTYVVCERLSVMHEPAGVVEILVQILQNTPILKFRIPPPKMKIVRESKSKSFKIPPSPNWNLDRSWHFKTF